MTIKWIEDTHVEFRWECCGRDTGMLLDPNGHVYPSDVDDFYTDDGGDTTGWVWVKPEGWVPPGVDEGS